MKIVFVGDINLGEYYTNFGCGPGTYSKSKNNFHNVEHILKGADFVIGNLEASICSYGLNADEPESVVLRAAPQSAKLLKENNFSLMQVANNHTIQHGQLAFEECLAVLEKNGLKYAGLNQAEPTIIEQNGVSVGFLAASDVPDNTDKNQCLYQRLDNSFFDLIKKNVHKVDHLVVLLHWGLEESTEPLPYQREMSEKLKSMGVRIIIGSHPHLFYEIEATDDFVCAYSLGNFVFDLCWDQRLLKSGILQVEIKDNKLESSVWPVTLKNNGASPYLSGEQSKIVGKIKLYDLGKTMAFQQIKKVMYHLINLHKGDSSLKWLFFKRKIFLSKKYKVESQTEIHP